MKLKYEKACIEAGLSEEKIREVRRVFDSDSKALNRTNKLIEDNNYIHISINSYDEETGCFLEIPDYDSDPALIVTRQLEMERLHELLESIGDEYRELVLAFYDTGIVFKDYLAEKGMTEGQARQIIGKIESYIRTFMYK